VRVGAALYSSQPITKSCLYK